ncbi:MAG: endonuclease MutS2, partial [Muribaculaceae bacterium]|nr:endonuclease MutS2 [Muribaculaceae bacterium]
MIFPDSFENKIGFDKIRELVKGNCSGPISAKEAEKMAFSSDYNVVMRQLWQTSEMVKIIRCSLDFPSGDVSEASGAVAELKAEGAYLSPKRLLALLNMMRQAEEVSAFFQHENNEEGEIITFPALSKVVERLASFPQLISAIDSTVNKFGEIKDTASDKLYDIRRSLQQAAGSMSRAMRRVLDRVAAEGIVDKDTSASMRDGRLVIPVEASRKRSIPGIVHDSSATGKTVFIEPLEVVEASNRMRELRMDEHR